MRRLHTLISLGAILVSAAVALAQETENYGPRPMIWAVPHITLQREEGGFQLLDGLDASIALPLTPRAHLTATYFLDLVDDDAISATLNYDHPLSVDTVLRGSVGVVRDDFGFGVTWHRAGPRYGVGAFAESVDGDFVGGLMLTRPISWGVTLGRVPTPRRSESRDWNSGAGGVADLGARAALSFSHGGGHGESATTTAYFPQRRTSWTREGGSAQSSSATGLEFAPPVRLAWTYSTQGPLRTSAAIVNGVAYVGSLDGWLYALEVSTGRRLWRFPAEAGITGSPAVAENRIYFATEAGEVYCVAPPTSDGPPTGRLVWRYRVGAPVTASPLVSDSRLVLVGAADSYLYALDRATGKLAWRLATGGPVVASVSKVSHRVPARVDAEGVATEKGPSAIVASADGKLYALDEVRGRVIWSFATDGPITGTPVVQGDEVYAANRSGSVYALQAANGRELWAFHGAGSLNEAPAIDEHRVYVAEAEGVLCAMDRASGQVAWRTALPAAIVNSPTVVRGGVMYVATRDGKLSALSTATGDVVWTMAQKEPLSTAPAIADGHMVVGGEKGTVYAFLPGTGVVMPRPAPPKPVASKAQGQGEASPTELVVAPSPAPPAAPMAAAVPTAPALGAPVVVAEPTQTVALPPTGVRPESLALPPVAPAVEPAVASGPATPPVPQPAAIEQPAAQPVVPAPAPKPTPAAPEPETPATPEQPVSPPKAAPTQPPADFPQPTQPPAPEQPERPVTPVPGPVAPPTTPQEPAPATGPLLTLLITPADGRMPTLLANQETIFVGGKVAPASGIERVRVNSIETPIRNGEYGTYVTFPGVGDYQLVVEAEDRAGKRTTHRRHVIVVAGRDPRASQVMELGQRGGSFIASFVPGVRNIDLSKLRKVIELRDDHDQLVRTWSMLADVTEPVSWNGADAEGKVLPAGSYTVVYVLVDATGAVISNLSQPLELHD